MDNLPVNSHPSGCNTSCRSTHLGGLALAKLAASGIPADLIALALSDEVYCHSRRAGAVGLSPAGRANLLAWGGNPDDIQKILGSGDGGEPVRLDYYARARERAANSRDRLGVDERRARDRAASARYRAKQRARSNAGPGASPGR